MITPIRNSLSSHISLVTYQNFDPGRSPSGSRFLHNIKLHVDFRQASRRQILTRSKLSIGTSNSTAMHPIPTRILRIFFPYTPQPKEKLCTCPEMQKSSDACRIRTCAHEWNRFLVYRYNHSAKAPEKVKSKIGKICRFDVEGKNRMLQDPRRDGSQTVRTVEHRIPTFQP